MIGKRLQARRKEAKVSLRELAKRTGLTASFISQVERDLSSPSITSLRRIADALDVPVFFFLADGTQPSPVIRRDQRRTLSLPNSRLTYELLSPLNRRLEAFIGRLEPGAVSSDAPASHPADEWIMVLEGKLQLELGHEVHELDEGDAIYYDGTIPHRLVSIGDRDLVYVAAISPPIL